MIRLEAVSRIYGDGAARFAALNGVTLAVERGEFLAVAGPSGSGKSTLLNLLGGLDAPASGRIEIDGNDLSRLAPNALADFRLARIGFVFQQFSLIPVLTAAENVAFPLLFRKDLSATARVAAVRHSLDSVGLGAKAHRRPAELSGGEQQRVAVARAVAGKPAILLADEPTANLDHETGGSVVALIRELNRQSGATLVLATHDAEILGYADRRVTLRDGQLVGAASRSCSSRSRCAMSCAVAREPRWRCSRSPRDAPR